MTTVQYRIVAGSRSMGRIFIHGSGMYNSIRRYERVARGSKRHIRSTSRCIIHKRAPAALFQSWWSQQVALRAATPRMTSYNLPLDMIP